MFDANPCSILYSPEMIQFPHSRLDFEAISCHTLSVLVDKSGAFFLGVIGCGEKHAFIALRLLFRAYAAGLMFVS